MALSSVAVVVAQLVAAQGAPMTWQRWALVVLGAVLALAGAFSAGRFTAPLKVETRDVERVVFKDRVVEKVVTVHDEAKVQDRIVYVDRVVTKEGATHEVVVTQWKTAEEKHTDTNAVTTAESTSEKVREVVKTVTLRPDWRVGVLAGASLVTPTLPIAGPLVVGAQVERRIVGGVSAGLWANSVGAAGVVVSLEF